MTPRKIIVVVVLLAALVWLAGVVANRRACNRCLDLDLTPVADESNSSKTNLPSPDQVSVPTPASRAVQDFMSKPLVVSWENTRDEILRSNASSADKADRLLALLPQLSGEEQAEAARHTANLLSDDHFLSAAACFTNATAPTNVQSLFMADLLNRPERVKLPLSLAVARNENHPCAAQAKELLQLYLTEDFGTDWSAWEAAVKARLQTNQ